jgi:hypothetical protein
MRAMTRRWNGGRGNGRGLLAGLCALLLASAVVVLSPSSAGAAPAGPYHIKFRHSGKCVDNWLGQDVTGNKIQQWACVAGNGSQKWYFDWTGGGYAMIRNADHRVCLTAMNGGHLNGSLVTTGLCNPAPDRQWKGRLVHDGAQDYYVLAPMSYPSSGLDVPHASTANGPWLQIWGYVGNGNQQVTWY